MKARIIFVLIVFGLSLGLTTTRVQAGPPWPATIIRADNIAITDWLNDDLDLNNPTWIYGETKTVYQPHSGTMTITAHGRMDYDLWEFASIEQLCAPESPYSFFCNGTGTLMVPRGMFWCQNTYGDVTFDTLFVANRSGEWHLTCQFQGVFH